MNYNEKFTDKQLKAIDLLASGLNKKETARIVDVNVSTIYLWLKNKNFKAEINRRILDNKENIDLSIMKYTDAVLKEIYSLATKAKSEKVRLDACTYLINRVAGSPVAKVEAIQVDQEKEEKK